MRSRWQRSVDDEQLGAHLGVAAVGFGVVRHLIAHAGLENEFSPVADKILLQITEAVQSNDPKKLKEIIEDNEGVITPSLKFEIENHIIAIESQRN